MMRAGPIVLFALASGCAAPGPPERTQRAAAPITSPTDDDGDPAVVALLDAQSRVVCTGTLIAPHVVLTAAHCEIDARTYPQFSVAFGSTVSSAIALGDARVHPDYQPATFTSDLAILVLRERAAAPPAPIVDRALDSSFDGSTVRIVGFGSTDGDAGTIGRKRQGTAKVSTLAAATFELAAAPSQPCIGDSGGPSFATIGGSEMLVGVTSHGDSACVMHATETRVDALRDFVVASIAAYADGSASAGARCAFAEQCANGAACVAATDAPQITYCAPSCASGCPTHMHCTNGSCLYDTPTPGAAGSSCTTDADCVIGECTTTHVCAERCQPNAPTCASGFTCEHVSDIRYYCLAEPPVVDTSGGCAVAPRDAPAWPLVAFGVVVLGARRRKVAR